MPFPSDMKSYKFIASDFSYYYVRLSKCSETSMTKIKKTSCKVFFLFRDAIFGLENFRAEEQLKQLIYTCYYNFNLYICALNTFFVVFF